MEDFAAAFVRFENGATLMLEMSWLLHHNVQGEAARIWLYGTEGGCEWPDAQFYGNRLQQPPAGQPLALMLTQEAMEPHALECVEFARAVAEGLPSPVPAGALTVRPDDPERHLLQPGGWQRDVRRGWRVITVQGKLPTLF